MQWALKRINLTGIKSRRKTCFFCLDDARFGYGPREEPRKWPVALGILAKPQTSRVLNSKPTRFLKRQPTHLSVTRWPCISHVVEGAGVLGLYSIFQEVKVIKAFDWLLYISSNKQNFIFIIHNKSVLSIFL